MSTNDFWSLVEKHKKKQNKGSSVNSGLTTTPNKGGSKTTSKATSGSNNDFWELVDKYKAEGVGSSYRPVSNFDIAPTIDPASTITVDAPVKKSANPYDRMRAKGEDKWYKTGLFEDGYDFGDITKTILGSDEGASLLDLTWNSAKRGYYNSLYGEESFKAMDGKKNNKEYYEKLLSGDEYQFTPGNNVAEGVSGAFELMGQMARQYTHPRTLALAGGAAGAAAIAGQVGPQVLLPEEIVSVPVAAAAGFGAGSAAANLEIEAGLAYNEMIEAGISHEIARKIALGVGTINAGLEAFQTDELFDAYRVTSGSTATKFFTKKLVEELAKRGVDVAKETAQEVLQEGVTIAGVQAGSKIDKGEWAYNASEVTDRLLGTAKSSALSFAMMNAPATARNTFAIANDQTRTGNLVNTENNEVNNEMVADKDDIKTVPTTQGESGFTGSYTGTKYNAKQSELLSAVSLPGMQNATDLSGRRDITFNDIGITDKQVQQQWVEAGLASVEKDADGADMLVVNDAMLMDERERRQHENKTQNALHSLPNLADKKDTGKVLYTGSPNTNIQQFKVGGDGSVQTGDRYGRGVYLTTNEGTAKNYAGENGRVYKTNADGLNIFDLNDTITPQMQESLRNELNGADKQVRNSILRNFRTEQTFDSFEDAEKFFNEQSKLWKEQDGEYSANKPEIKEADHETGKAVIEFTDFANWENNIANLTGNQLYDALKSISTDDFSSFITGNGFDGIAFDEDSDNQQYVIYRNEDRLQIDDGKTNPTVADGGETPTNNPAVFTTENLDADDGILPMGKLVRASDRGNYGFVEDYDDATGLYSVRFTSSTGSSAVVEFSADELSPVTTAKEMFPNEPDRDQFDYENASAVKEATENRLREMADLDEKDWDNPELVEEYNTIFEAWTEANTTLNELNAKMSEQFETLDDADAPPEKTFDAPVKAEPKVAEVLEKPSKKHRRKGFLKKFATRWIDKGSAVEKLSLDTGNMELQAKWNSALPSYTDGMAQNFMQKGAKNVPSLKRVLKEQKKSGKTNLFDQYMYHLRNIDDMTLQERMNLPNVPVFGESVTAEVSRKKVAQWEKQNPDFKRWAQAYYANSNYMLDLMVKEGVVSQESADYFRNKRPHYVPIVRDGIVDPDVSQDTNKLGVGNPIKTATGGDSKMEPLANAMAQRIEQTYRAIARNRFGIELRNTLDTTRTEGKNLTHVENVFGSDYENGLLKPSSFESRPTFTVFEDGNRFEFEITDDLYDALKPTSDGLAYRNPLIAGASEFRRKLLTVWNPVFVLYRNPIKDMQDVAVNSQHPVRTYANVPKAMIQLLFNGKMAQEYRENGGGANTYYDSKKNQFVAEDNVFKKVFGLPFKAIEVAGEFIEQTPRLAEYIASRNEGRSVERSMLDAARVTTNFAAGGDFTRFANSHGCTFLNASVQGAAQHVRNFREATKLEGFKGLTKTLAKYVIAGVPTLIFNSLLWDDDEEYEELNDYVKQNYYVVAKTGEGKFVRIPKGRTAAVMGEIFEQMENLVTGDDEADFETFFDLFMENIAPNNPLTDNMYAPIFQAASNNAWYNADIVPSRLQDFPAEEQFDESTDSLSKWLGEKIGWSPMKINYLLDQYSGGIGDVVLPMMTPEAESGDDSFVGNMLAPWKKEITTDKELNNKNPGLFFELSDEVEAMSNAKDATQEDKMKAMYIQSVGWEISDLYAQKRDIQNSNYSDAVKYDKVRQLQEQINDLAKKAMESYEDVTVNGLYSEVGDKRFNYDTQKGKWYEITPKNADGTANYYYQREQEVTKGLGISYREYWNNREEYEFAYDEPKQYKFAKAFGGYESYKKYYDVLDNWKSDSYISADKDEEGNPINGSKKEKIIDYLNELDADYGEKIVLFKHKYPKDDTYNQDIFDYINGRDDLSYSEKVFIFKYLEFKVDSEGYVTW